MEEREDLELSQGAKQVTRASFSGRAEDRKGNPRALLVGMQTGAATVENSMESPQKTKDGTAF